MLENLKQKINKAIEKQDKVHLMTWKPDSIEGLFNMKYLNDWLKYSAMNEQQLENALSFEKHINDLMKNLYVPSYEQENV